MKILGFQKYNAVTKWFVKSDISVVCSRWDEPFGRTALEASSAGCAVIITDKGGLSEASPKAMKIKTLTVKNIENSIKEPTFLLQNKEFPFFDTTHSKETHNTISLINLNSIKEFSDKITTEIEFQRFRGNIYIDNIDPWEERKWVGKIISINDIKFKVDMHIPRCSATNLKPQTDINTINLPLEINKIYKHSDMGVYLKPLESGIININDKIII